jgi:hypothetical protein
MRSGREFAVAEPSAFNDVLGDGLLRGHAGHAFKELAEDLVVSVAIDARSATGFTDRRRPDTKLDQVGRLKPCEPVVVQSLGRGVLQRRKRLEGWVRIREVIR